MMLHTCTITFHNKIQFCTLNLKKASSAWKKAQEELQISDSDTVQCYMDRYLMFLIKFIYGDR